MRRKNSNKTIKEYLFKALPIAGLVLLYLEFDARLWPGWFTLWFVANAFIAAGITKLLFPDLFDDYLARQRKIQDVAKSDYTQLQIRRFTLVHLTLLVSWWLLNLIKFL